MPNLIIVESPTKARTLSRFLGSEYRIEATMGHIRDLPEKKLGIEIKEQRTDNKEQKIIKYEFIPQYQIIAGRKERIKELEKLAKSASQVLLATDPDREGEAIAWHVRELLKSNTSSTGRKSSTSDEKNTFTTSTTSPTFSTFRRIVFHEITKTAILHALESPREIDMQLVDAQQARRLLDRLVGYKLSPLLWNKLGKRWLSAGRVQSVVVRLIVDREREILAFKSEEYWIIEVELEKREGESGKGKVSFLARLAEINDQKDDLSRKELADKSVSDLKISKYKVTDIEIKDSIRYPAPPFITSTLQQAASNKFGWTAKRTIRTAQNLYEEGLITYHRTDSTNLSKESLEMVRSFILKEYGQAYLPQSAKIYKTKSKVAQEAHEAIRPTDVTQISNLKSNILNLVGRDGMVLYELIWKRFVASQMNEAVNQITNVFIEAFRSDLEQTKYQLKAQGERMKFDGWTKLYGVEKIKEIPPLNSGEILEFINIFPQQKFTEPPGRFTEATLIKILEENGIGRPSTYAPIISTIQDRKYVEKIERKFAPTDLGFMVNDFLVKHFPNIFEVNFTAKLEADLDEIANGAVSWNKVIGDFYSPFITTIDRVFKEAERVKMDLGETDEKCPKCGSSLVYKLSKFGKFLACSNYPKCTFTKNIIEKAGIACPKCGADMIVKKTRRGKQFYGCGNFPTCTFAAWKKEDIK